MRTSASSQPIGPPLVVPRDPATQQAFEQRRSAYLAHQKCIADDDSCAPALRASGV
jgi:hypothetical protein